MHESSSPVRSVGAAADTCSMQAWGDPTFRPWVGRHYGRASHHGHAVLVVLESHYDEGFGKGSGLTEYVVREHVRGKAPQRTFSAVEDAFGGFQGRSRAFWDSVALYNYVQSWTVPGRGVTQDQLRKSWTPFVRVTRELRPDVVAVFSTVVGRSIADKVQTRELGLTMNGTEPAVYAELPFAAPGAGILGWLRHPRARQAQALRIEDARPILQTLMVAARAKHGRWF
jgi:hypothetical protein